MKVLVGYASRHGAAIDAWAADIARELHAANAAVAPGS